MTLLGHKSKLIFLNKIVRDNKQSDKAIFKPWEFFSTNENPWVKQKSHWKSVSILSEEESVVSISHLKFSATRIVI